MLHVALHNVVQVSGDFPSKACTKRLPGKISETNKYGGGLNAVGLLAYLTLRMTPMKYVLINISLLL